VTVSDFIIPYPFWNNSLRAHRPSAGLPM
jgi:hypothetical protein